MSEKTYIDLGQVTAYAYAKAHGYTGTEEEFAIEQAHFAQNAQQVAEDRVVVREDRTHVDDVVETFTETTAPEAVQRVTTEGDTQVARVQGVGNVAVQDVTDTKDQALQDIDDAGESEVSGIQTEGNTQVGRVRTEGTTQVGNVNTAGTTQVSAVNQAGNTQVGLVRAEGTTQVQNVEDKGQEIIDALPPNYEEDMAQVEDFLENLVKVSETQPESEANKLWIEDQAEEEIEVPTYEEFESLSNDVSDAKNAISQLDTMLEVASPIVITSADLQRGSYSNAQGAVVSTNRLRNITPIYCKGGTLLTFDTGALKHNVAELSTSALTGGNVICSSGFVTDTVYRVCGDCYLMILFGNSSDSTITVADFDPYSVSASGSSGVVDDVSSLFGTGLVDWEQGSYNVNGQPIVSNTRIRTPVAYGVKQGYIGVDCDNSYSFGVQAFNASGEYIGLYQTDNTWAKANTKMALMRHFSFVNEDWEGYTFRLIGKMANDAAITPSAGDNFVFSTQSFVASANALSGEYNIMSFGAKGNGTTNDSNVIQSVLNMCRDNGGGTIYFPPGTYLIKTALVVYSNTHIVLSDGATLLRGDNIRCLIHSYCAVDTTVYNGEHDIVIEGGVLDLGTGFTQGAANVAFIHAQNITIRNSTMRHASKGYHFCDIAGCKNVLIENCVFSDALTNENTACFIQVDCPWGQITYTYDGYADGSACFDSTPCVQFVVKGCTFYLNQYSPAFGNHNDGLNKYIFFVGNYVYGGNSTRGAIAFADYKDYNYTDVIYIHDNLFSGCDYGFKFMNDGTGRAYIKNNIFENVGTLQVNPNSPVGVFSENVSI